ncbi:MAG TPA: lasso peptide biosynthesis B2 protein [Devosia sp.]|nr:lasso peptide biosynthesis B2 protein [Devosia sp.]
MTYVIRPQLHLCRISGHVVGLDLQSSRYTLFRGAVAKRLGHFLAASATESEIDWLIDRGLVQDGDNERPWPCWPPPVPTASIDFRSVRLVPPTLVARALLAQLRAKSTLSRRPLSLTLQELDMAMRGARHTTLENCGVVAAAFHRAKRYLSETDQCLVRGIAMARLLARRGERIHLVVGVTLPFAAHCWIQAGTTVLTDDIDRVRAYSPIFAL